jgi:hypothetical protein
MHKVRYDDDDARRTRALTSARTGLADGAGVWPQAARAAGVAKGGPCDIAPLSAGGHGISGRLLATARPTMSADGWHNVRRRAVRTRRKLACKGVFLSGDAFCQRSGSSRTQLVREERRGGLFNLRISRETYAPAVLADNSLDKHRLAKLLRRMAPYVPAIGRYDLLVSRRGPLGGKTALEATRRGKRYRVALRLADSVASENRPRGPR